MIRLPGCDGGGETTVLCHYRDSSTGMGQKENDLIGAWGCSHCHDVVDGRTLFKRPGAISKEAINTVFLEAIIRTQREIIRMGVIK